jgi:hypothetical protein
MTFLSFDAKKVEKTFLIETKQIFKTLYQLHRLCSPDHVGGRGGRFLPEMMSKS